MTSEILSNREERRYKNQIALTEIGQIGQEKLKKSKIAIIGSGGIGTSVAQNLVAMGIGTIGITDNDMVEESNIHRQTLYGTSDLGKQKAIISKQKLNELNAQTEINIHNLCISFANMDQTCNTYDLLVDASNTWETNSAVWNYCAQFNKPLVYGRIREWKVEIGVFNNPVELYSHLEKKEEIEGGKGFLGPVASLTGAILSIEVVKLILGIESHFMNKGNSFNAIDIVLSKSL